jgi:hypothetical protein
MRKNYLSIDPAAVFVHPPAGGARACRRGVRLVGNQPGLRS